MKLEIPTFTNTKILVVGDVMLDRYWHGNTSRISPEAPVPVVHVNMNETKERPGGAGNVALNLADIGCETSLLGICGQDEMGNRLEKILQDGGVLTHLLKLPNLPTIVKLRILSLHQQLIRLDFEETLQQIDCQALLPKYESLLPNMDAIILSDYGKGGLQFSRQLIAAGKKYGIPILVDPKRSDFSFYEGATLITPNRKEFEAVVGECKDNSTLVERALNLIDAHDLGGLLITRGEQGMTLVQPGVPALHLPTHAQEVFDVTGAGDTVVAVMAAAIAAGQTFGHAAQLANIAAGIVVGKLGTATVNSSELRRALQLHQSENHGVFSEDQVCLLVEDAKAHNERIVFTNGCFDILHAGHIAYLKQAKALGDRLIVAINDDESVRRLKGSTRPINSLADRMEVLSALNMVDWVISFSEDTPARLIQRLLPHVLVKGGDYKVSEIVGADTVLANGGEVEVLDFLPGRSTSKIVEQIRNAETTE